MALDIQHARGTQQFKVVVDGVTCVLDYLLFETTMRITHTGVPAAVGGRGIAGELVRTALDYARSRGWRVELACSYAEVWVERHPAYQDLVA
ncbi:MAG: N-acetyltransferase [Rhodanobacter sp.]|nr:MAG: N-acetyltransferase [Rhodanobacter sp.]TAM14532.1 MAG: N-acetyltransferase [Rhodanobacter sp.]TAM37323.1 MAG: N-acetyltransferase [Rhodanobacter sp.]